MVYNKACGQDSYTFHRASHLKLLKIWELFIRSKWQRVTFLMGWKGRCGRQSALVTLWNESVLLSAWHLPRRALTKPPRNTEKYAQQRRVMQLLVRTKSLSLPCCWPGSLCFCRVRAPTPSGLLDLVLPSSNSIGTGVSRLGAQRLHAGKKLQVAIAFLCVFSFFKSLRSCECLKQWNYSSPSRKARKAMLC